jgi:hypothetical protein
MDALSERKLEIVRHLVESAPDRVVGGLQQALSQTGVDSPLGPVKLMVAAEAADRTLRNITFQPIAPMCVTGGDDPGDVTFPPRVLALIWRALKETQPEEVDLLRADDYPEPYKRLDAQDQMSTAALEGIREGSHPDFVAAGEAAESIRPGGRDQLLACLEISPVVRRATQRLPEWLAHAGADTTASARLAYKDAVVIADDAGPLFFHMLAAQMAQPWMVMRVISSVMDKPTERYLKDSELASFAEKLMAEIDRSIAAIASMKADEGPEAGRLAAARTELAVHQILEMEGSVELPRDQGWGQRVVKQRAGLAGAVEARLKEAEKAGIEALPMFVPRNQRVRHQIPLLTAPPEDRLVVRTITLLTFSHELRSTANYGGFSTARNKLVEKLGEYIDHYVESVVDRLRTDDVEDRQIAASFLEKAADFNLLIRGEKAADLTRRRAHSALHSDSQPSLTG